MCQVLSRCWGWSSHLEMYPKKIIREAQIRKDKDFLHHVWVADHWKLCKCSLCLCVCQSPSHVWLCDPMDCSSPGSSVHGILQKEYWSGLPFPSPGDHPDPGIEPSNELTWLHFCYLDKSYSSVWQTILRAQLVLLKFYNFFPFYYLFLHRGSLSLVWLFFLCSNLFVWLSFPA